MPVANLQLLNIKLPEKDYFTEIVKTKVGCERTRCLNGSLK